MALDAQFQKRVIFVNALVPAALMALDGWRGQLGANPVEFVTRCTGVLTLLFLLLSLSVTPLRKQFSWNWLAKHRRLLGLYSFFYGVSHLGTYLGFDRDWDFASIPGDVWKRPFIALGMLSFLAMIPLAVTSTNAMIKKIGAKRWAKLHRLTYAIAIGGVLHFYMIVKSDVTYPVAFGWVLALLLLYRLILKLLNAQKSPARP